MPTISEHLSIKTKLDTLISGTAASARDDVPGWLDGAHEGLLSQDLVFTAEKRHRTESTGEDIDPTAEEKRQRLV